MAYDVGTYGNIAVRMPLFVLLTILSLIGLALHAVAIAARLAAGLPFSKNSFEGNGVGR